MRDCRLALSRLSDLLEGTLAPAERREVERHLAGCPDCGEIAALARREPGRSAADPPPELLGAVLARTSGAPCAAARERLCDLVDERLAPGSRALVTLHLDECAACRATAASLTRLSRELPELGRVRPDPAFVADVLARTTERSGWVTRLVAAWLRLLARPRLALEGAYLGTILLAVTVGLPGTGAVTDSLGSFRAEPLVQVRRQTGDVAALVESHARDTCRDAARGLSDASRRLASDAARVSTATFTRIREGIGTFLDADAWDQESGAGEPTPRDPRDQGDT